MLLLPFLIFCLELFVLYIFSKHISLQTSELFLKVFKNHQASGVLLAILFLPGTLIHELAHFLMAKVLFVKTTHFTLIPKIGVESIEMGSVGIIKPDPIRRLLIGIAPFLLGTFLILLGIHLYQLFQISFNFAITCLFIYGLFTISNTMFSSKKDLEGAAKLLVIILVISLIFYILGFRIPPINYEPLVFLFNKASQLLLIPLLIDLIFLLVIMILNRRFRL